MSNTVHEQPLIVCHACDLAQRRIAILGRGRALCRRCHAELERNHSAHLDTAIALALSALVLLLLTNSYPLVVVRLEGAGRAATLWDAAVGLYHQGYQPMAALIFFTTILVPFIQVLSLLSLLLSIRLTRRPAAARNPLFRTLAGLRPWAMVEVFLLGAVVAFVKLGSYADVKPGIALWSCGFLMVALSALNGMVTPAQFWHWSDRGGA